MLDPITLKEYASPYKFVDYINSHPKFSDHQSVLKTNFFEKMFKSIGLNFYNRCETPHETEKVVKNIKNDEEY